MIENVVSDVEDGKTVQWTVLSESPSSYAAKALVGYIKTVKPEDCLTGQDAMKVSLNYFGIKYE